MAKKPRIRSRRIKEYNREAWTEKTFHKGIPVKTVGVLASVSPNGIDNRAPITIRRAPWENEEVKP